MVTNVNIIPTKLAKKSLNEEIKDLIQLEKDLPVLAPQLIDDTKLSPRQLIFVSEYVKSGEPKQSAIRAGYAEASAAVTAHHLLENPKIIEAIDKVFAALRLASEEPKNRIEQELFEVIIEAKIQGNHLVLLKALDMVCKINSLYQPTTQLTQDNSLTINYIVPQDAPKIQSIDI